MFPVKNYIDRYCYDLPTSPRPHLRVLVTGATGYIGGELIPELISRGYKVRLMVRKLKPQYYQRWPSAEIVVADVLDYNSLEPALEGIDCAYYFIHSLYNSRDFIKLDKKGAKNFRKASDKIGLKRIIYLGSLGDPEYDLSDHLSSRIEVAEYLMKGKASVTFLRAAVVIGSGSASYQMINKLVRRCPVFLFPSWASSKCQPISIRDVIKYLVGCLENEETTGKTLDIGGRKILSYRTMIKIQAAVMNKRRLFINSSLSLLNFYVWLTKVFTSMSPDLIKSLMESCRNDVVCENEEIRELIPFETVSYPEALSRALNIQSQAFIFQKKRKLIKQKKRRKGSSGKMKPPIKSKNIFSDIFQFMLHKAKIPTRIKFNTRSERDNYYFRIIQRLDVSVKKYKILNIHKIGVDTPVKYIFEELLKWNGDSSCWPNYIARVHKDKGRLENLIIYLLGWKFMPLFKLNAINIKKVPDILEPDNARYLLFSCSGGYPIGVFSMYVRSSNKYQMEIEKSQLFLMVGFNFYGKERFSKYNVINKIWEKIHNRVTANVLNRLKQLCEWRYEKLREGSYSHPEGVRL